MRDAAGQLSDRLQTLSLPQGSLRGLTTLGFGMEPPRTPQRNPDNEKKEQCRGQAEDEVTRHSRDPLGPDRRAIDAGYHVDREALELALTHAPFGRVDLGLRDRADAALLSLRDHRV